MADTNTATEPEYTTVALRRDLANRLKVVAAHRDKNQKDVLVDLLEGPLDRAYRKAVSAANEEFGGES